MLLAPPIEIEYPSYERAKKGILEHAREEGYGIAEKRSKKDKRLVTYAKFGFIVTSPANQRTLDLYGRLLRVKWAVPSSSPLPEALLDWKTVNRPFFAHSAAIALARTWPEVLLVDATCRTNYYNIPLLHFLGRLPTGKNFTVA